MFLASDKWCVAYPGAHIGFLTLNNVANPAIDAALDQRKQRLERELRERYAGLSRGDLRAISPLAEYHAYYKRFKKSYHVQLQLESIVFKGKGIPQGAALVETMFMAELDNLLLTAGHDLDQVRRPVEVHVAQGSEVYTRINGQEQRLKPGDMYIADQAGVLSSILYGPDARTKIGSETRRAIFTVYAPEGIPSDSVRQHLLTITILAQIINPETTVEHLEILPGSRAAG